MSDQQQELPGSGSGGGQPPAYSGMPGWVKWFVIGAIVLGIVLIIGPLFGRGEHGPGRHNMSPVLTPDCLASASASPWV